MWRGGIIRGPRLAKGGKLGRVGQRRHGRCATYYGHSKFNICKFASSSVISAVCGELYRDEHSTRRVRKRKVVSIFSHLTSFLHWCQG